MVWLRYKKFELGKTHVSDEQRSGWPSMSTTNDVYQIEGLIEASHHIHVREIVHKLNISTGNVLNIVHKKN